jgi:hypothetical protein
MLTIAQIAPVARFRTGVLAPLTMALAVRSDPSWQPVPVVSLAAGALFVVFLLLPWGNASFLMAIVTKRSASYVVKINTRARAPTVVNSRVAEMPLSTGIRMSISTTSGSSCRVSSMVSRPLPA